VPDYKRGYLSEYFEGFAAKRLTKVEIDPDSSQHEFQGVKKLKKLLGAPSDKVSFSSRFLWLDNESESDSVDSFVTWSDVRRDNPSRSAEYHLYYSAEAARIVHKASPGDLLLVCKQKKGDLITIVASAGGTIERQLSWLFDFPLEEDDGPIVRELNAYHDKEVGFAARLIFDELGIETGQTDENFLDLLLDRFGETFPPTREFSEFARETLIDIFPQDNPDEALLVWMDHEEKLFRTLEKHIVGDRLREGFYSSNAPDVDGFIKFSLSVQNRRKSRAGQALENHLESIFKAHNIHYSRGAITEGNKKPDFIFPGASEYQNHKFPKSQLTILGAKSSCKDRWRQVLTEAERVKTKHLVTLEPGISQNQTDEMKGENLQLVIPKALHNSYSSSQQAWLQDLSGFIDLVLLRQAE
jgi:hypothetical protein